MTEKERRKMWKTIYKISNPKRRELVQGVRNVTYHGDFDTCCTRVVTESGLSFREAVAVAKNYIPVHAVELTASAYDCTGRWFGQRAKIYHVDNRYVFLQTMNCDC